MRADAMRVAVLALAALGLAIASTWLLDWLVLVVRVDGTSYDIFAIDLTDATCVDARVCGKFSIGIDRSLFGKFAAVTRWLTVILSAIVVVQAGAKLVTGTAAQAITRVGYVVGAGTFVAAVFTAFIFQPEIPFDGPISIDRTWAPAMLLGGIVFAMFALFYATQTAVNMAMLPPARVVTRPIPPVVEEPSVPVGRTPTRPRPPTVPPPEALRGKLQFAAATAELTRAGIDARREDGKTVLVMWRDVVGVVARRLPEIYAGTTFVDVVSTAGSTLRLLPWTRITGDLLETAPLDAADRAHAIVQLTIAQCPDVQIDRATREFIERRAPAAQLPDPATLAAHDARLA